MLWTLVTGAESVLGKVYQGGGASGSVFFRKNAMGRKRNKHKAPVAQPTPTSAKDLSKSVEKLKIADAALDRVDGLSGFALAKELHMLSLEICKSGNAKFENPDDQWAFDILLKYKLDESEDSSPVVIIPAAVENLLLKHGLGGGCIDVQRQFDVHSMGKMMKEFANIVLNQLRDDGALLLTLAHGALLKPFEDVRGLKQILPYATKTEMTMISILIKNIVPQGLNNACVKSSPIHGNGVFARRKIKKGDIITMYPCDGFILNIPGNGDLHAKANGDAMLYTEAALLSAYSATVGLTGVSICGDPDKHTNAACGHIINDGSSLLKDDFEPEDVVKYMEESTATCNCYFVSLSGVVLAVVACKDINKGEEVLTSYGAAFWAKYARMEFTSP